MPCSSLNRAHIFCFFARIILLPRRYIAFMLRRKTLQHSVTQAFFLFLSSRIFFKKQQFTSSIHEKTDKNYEAFINYLKNDLNHCKWRLFGHVVRTRSRAAWRRCWQAQLFLPPGKPMPKMKYFTYILYYLSRQLVEIKNHREDLQNFPDYNFAFA
jgi:hypothetical protein